MSLKNSSFDIIDDEHGNDTSARNTMDAWKVLVVDDDEDIHLATRFALKNIEILEHRLQLIHCHGSAEALKILEAEPDIAVAIIDVVMESSDAGLKLINQIRGHDAYQEMRIILRTGQPGYAPELSVITDYDINAYPS